MCHHFRLPLENYIIRKSHGKYLSPKELGISQHEEKKIEEQHMFLFFKLCELLDWRLKFALINGIAKTNKTASVISVEKVKNRN